MIDNVYMNENIKGVCPYIAVVLSDDLVECRDQGTFVF